MISQALSGAVTTRIASAFGLSEVQVRKVVDATIPALLGALISLVSKSARFDLFPRNEDNHSTEFWNLFGTYSKAVNPVTKEPLPKRRVISIC
jgi:hypothetical protein